MLLDLLNSIPIVGLIYTAIGLLGVFHYSKIPIENQDKEIKKKRLTSIIISLGGLATILLGSFDIITSGNPLNIIVIAIAIYYVVPILKDVFPRKA